jgi:hypothetical protein
MLGGKQEVDLPLIDPDASAVLAWLPQGSKPSDADFQTEQSWTLEEAAEQAYNVAMDHNLRPWIKTDGKILDEFEIRQVMSGLDAIRLMRASGLASTTAPTRIE